MGMEIKPLASEAFIPVAHNPESGVAVLGSSANPLDQSLGQGTMISNAWHT